MYNTLERKNKRKLVKVLALLYMGTELLQRKYVESKEPSRKSNDTKQRRYLVRKSWDSFQQNISTKKFRRYFRMEKDCFKLLVSTVERNVGEENFKSEVYIKKRIMIPITMRCIMLIRSQLEVLFPEKSNWL